MTRPAETSTKAKAAMGFLLLAMAFGGCPSPPAAVAPEGAFERAVEMARSSDEAGAMAALHAALESDPDAYQRTLLEPAFGNGLRDRDDFRQAVHEAAVKHRISTVTLAPEDEPGEWIEVEGRCVDRAGEGVSGAVVRLFATDADGRYHPTIEGERMPRLFATLVTDDEGRFTFRTVRPGPYPGTRNARHIHLSSRAGALRLAAPHYMVFDDDPLLAEPQNAEQRGEALRIAMRTVNGESRGTLILPMR